VKLGGDPDRLVVRQTNDPTKIFDYIYGELYELLQEGMPLKAIMIDSIKNIAFPKDIKDVSTNMVQGGSGAAYLGPVLKRIMPVIREFHVTTILIQQIYEEMDQYKKLRNPYIVPDGRALKHFCDYMVQIDKIDKKDSIVESGKTLIGTEQQIGHKVRLKVKKNRVGKPYRIAEFTLLYASGIANVANELYDLAKSLSIIYHPVNEEGRANPQMWQFGNYDPIRGEDNMRQFVVGDVKVQQEMMLACESASEDAIKARSQAIGGDDVDVDPESL
jgi:RecA/RadA recombinase